MGRRGPAPKPTALKKLEGNPGKRKLNKAEPEPKGKLPTAPAALSPEAKRVWARLGKQLLELGLMTAVDGPIFALLCESYAAWTDCIKLGRQHGPVVKIAGELRPNPYLQRADREAEKVRKLAAEFGLSPASRSRLQIAPPKPNEKQEDSLEGFLRIAN